MHAPATHPSLAKLTSASNLLAVNRYSSHKLSNHGGEIIVTFVLFVLDEYEWLAHNAKNFFRVIWLSLSGSSCLDWRGHYL